MLHGIDISLETRKNYPFLQSCEACTREHRRDPVLLNTFIESLCPIHSLHNYTYWFWA